MSISIILANALSLLVFNAMKTDFSSKMTAWVNQPLCNFTNIEENIKSFKSAVCIKNNFMF